MLRAVTLAGIMLKLQSTIYRTFLFSLTSQYLQPEQTVSGSITTIKMFAYDEENNLCFRNVFPSLKLFHYPQNTFHIKRCRILCNHTIEVEKEEWKLSLSTSLL